ncbi:MAG: tetratricopeptide repeat protein [Woeseiaceae bacterium]
MLSWHSTNRVRVKGLALLATLLFLGACASGPKPAEGEPGQAAAGEPGMDRDIPPKALTLYEQAVASMAAGDSIDAELRFQEFLLQYPNYPGAHVNLAIIFAERDDLQAAENSLTDALIIDPEYAQALNQLGMLLRRQGKFEEAESAYLKAVTVSPDYALAHYNLGVLNDLYLRRLDAALTHYERYQELSGEDKQVTRWIADLKRRIGSQQRTANVTE